MTEGEAGLGRCSPYLQCDDSPRTRSGTSTHQFGHHCQYCGWRGSKIYDTQVSMFAMFTPCGLAEEARGRLQGCGKSKEGVQVQNTKPGPDACPGTCDTCDTCIQRMPSTSRPVSTLAVRHGDIAAQVTQPAAACSWAKVPVLYSSHCM
ncbi:uncharacterized protein TrAtP1_003972 [Trichoderma atroviride]|uniref:uncharacterized protein n=1 Tax=Hypocrea atroviridis TaxID=63577 RepID=UPI00331650A9|nr:hypothetical protein TrAtP1_003972 [Trichoderma atroviride]